MMKCSKEMTTEERDRLVEITALRADKIVGTIHDKSTLCPRCAAKFALAAVLKSLKLHTHLDEEDLLDCALEAFAHVADAVVVRASSKTELDDKVEKLRKTTGGSIH